MVMTLSKEGDRLALVLDREMLESLQIDESTVLDVSTVGRSLIVSPRDDLQQRAEFERAVESANRRYGNALRRLAE